MCETIFGKFEVNITPPFSLLLPWLEQPASGPALHAILGPISRIGAVLKSLIELIGLSFKLVGLFAWELHRIGISIRVVDTSHSRVKHGSKYIYCAI